MDFAFEKFMDTATFSFFSLPLSKDLYEEDYFFKAPWKSGLIIAGGKKT
jgi:hypothetical protein